MIALERIAPVGNAVSEYDRSHLALYAALIEAADEGRPWRNVVAELMRLDPADAASKICWGTHLERARWIIGNGMAEAIVAFNVRPESLESQ
jgi:hypothetical protein